MLDIRAQMIHELCHDCGIDHTVLDDQEPLARHKLLNRHLLILCSLGEQFHRILQLKIEYDCKRAANAARAVYGNRSAHELGQPVRDPKAQTGSLIFVYIFPCKWLEQLLLEFLTDTDAVVFHLEFI